MRFDARRGRIETADGERGPTLSGHLERPDLPPSLAPAGGKRPSSWRSARVASISAAFICNSATVARPHGVLPVLTAACRPVDDGGAYRLRERSQAALTTSGSNSPNLLRATCASSLSTVRLCAIRVPLHVWLGGGIASCLQMRIAVNSTISLWRGMDARRLTAGFSQIECSLPSRTNRHPCWRRYESRSRRFMPPPDRGRWTPLPLPSASGGSALRCRLRDR